MPIEREFKYVLDHRGSLATKIEELGVQGTCIQQAYLSKGGRIRSKQTGDKIQYVFTYKHKLKSQPGCLEIEHEITENDFRLGWLEADHVIDKTRYVVQCTNAFVWEIDVFRDQDGSVYFAMAECEVHEGQERPDVMHDFVKDNLIFEVPEKDGRFQNRKISNVAKAGKLFKEVVSGKA